LNKEGPDKKKDLLKQISDLSILHEQRKFQELFDISYSLNKKYPKNINILNSLALASIELENLKMAKQSYIDMFDLDVKSEFSYIFSNAGNLFFDTGDNNKSIEFHEKAIDLDSKNLTALRGLGLALENSGNVKKAIECYKKGLEIDSNNDSINFHLANVYRVQNRFDEAIHHYELSDTKLSKTNQLECIYKSNNKNLFNEKLKNFITNKTIEPLVASLSSHASIRFDQNDEYTFCKNPFDYICTANLYNDERFNDTFITGLVEEINQSNISKKTQSLLKNGYQSSGNLFLNDSPNMKIMESIVMDSIKSFRTKFSDKNCDLIKNWPKDFSVISWLIIIKKGGNLLAHMHKHGWISGSIYLNIPKKISKDEGNIKFSLHGADYPHDNKAYPSKIVDITKGNMVLFPSSLFHSTIPFSSEEERLTLAFDVIPN